jgi:glutathione peroxidase
MSEPDNRRIRPMTAATSVYDFSAQTIQGKPVDLKQFKGRVLLIVNTASACGFTPQFKGLQALWERYGQGGLTVLGFPSNEFGAQDPGSNDEIASFCEMNYGVDFPMMSKIEVNGAGAHPLYQWLTAEAPGLLGTKGIKWNFTKFLLGRDGRVIQRYAPQDAPEKLAKDIEAALAG